MTYHLHTHTNLTMTSPTTTLSHTICHIHKLNTQLCHMHLVTSTFVSRGERDTISHPPSFHVAGVALMALCGALGRRWSPVTPRHFAWQAWHLKTSTFVSRGRRGTWRHPPSFHVSTFVLRGRRGTYGTVWRAWSPLVAGDAAALCVAGVALGDIHLRFPWQVCTWRHPPSFCLAGVALMALCGALGRHWSPVTPRHFAWQAWHLVTSTFVLRGRCGTRRHPPSFCVAGVALMALCGALGRRWSPVTPRHFAWQAWHLVTSTFVSRGKCGTWRHPPWFHVAGVAQSHIHFHFGWQVWHLWHCVARL